MPLNTEVWDAAALVVPASSMNTVITITCVHLQLAARLPKVMATEVRSIVICGEHGKAKRMWI